VVVHGSHGNEGRQRSGPVVIFGVQTPERFHRQQLVGIVEGRRCPSPQDVALVADLVHVISGEISPRADTRHPVGKFTL